MAGGFDVSRAVGAGLGDRRRVLEFVGEFAAAWTRPLVREDGYGQDVLQSVEEHLGVRLPSALREAYLAFGRTPTREGGEVATIPLVRVLAVGCIARVIDLAAAAPDRRRARIDSVAAWLRLWCTDGGNL